MKFLDKIFPVKKAHYTDTQERTLAKEGSERQRRAMAGDESTSQEILYYMAENDLSVAVRKAVADNRSTPMQAAPLLARDANQDVRMVLARRLVRMLPSLAEDKYSQLYAFAVQSLGMLALDEVLKIRKALSETLKDHAHAPPAVALQLAKDLEREVSEPILKFCAALSDENLIEVLQTHPANWAAEAIAGRKTLSGAVSQAVLDTGNTRAGQILLSNDGADIPADLLVTIIERAREYPEWHKPLAMRKGLPPMMAMKLAAYVDNAVKKLLLERGDFDAVTVGEISAIMKRRVEFEAERKHRQASDHSVERAKKLYADGGMTEEILGDALAMRDTDFVIACLALRAKTTIVDIEKVFDVRAPKAICAVVWKAGFSMRLALKLQQTLGRVPHQSLIYPRGGTDYPFTEEELRWQLSVIGL